MINENDLRIGNWVHHLPSWSYRQEKNKCNEFRFKWELSDFYALVECTLEISIIEPIDITEEILLNADFNSGVSNFVGCYYKDMPHNKVLIIPFDKNSEARISMPYRNGVMTIAQNIKYVHQLQNLWFSLTNTELNIEIRK